MKEETRKYSNIFWSFREYLRSNMPSIKRYYNPQSLPKPTSVDKWIIFQMGIHEPDLFSRVIPRIHCVSRKDADESELIELVSDVIAIFDSPSTGRKYIPFYDKDSDTIIGDIWINSISVGPRMPYDTGIISKAIEIHSTVKTDRKMNYG